MSSFRSLRVHPVVGLLAAALAACLCLASPDVRAQAPASDQPWAASAYFPGAEDLRFPSLPEGAELLSLENGLQVLLLPNPLQPMTGIFTQVRVGSAYEDFRTSGMSHMLEHLLFNGTEKYDQEALYALADRHGAYNNANTTSWYTNFMTILPSIEVAAGVELQSQMLFHSTLPAENFAKEQQTVLGELAQARDRGGAFAEAALRQVLYEGSSLALPTLGTASTIANMRRDDVDAFYRAHYVPNNMITTVAGGFDRDEVLDLLREHYGETAPGTPPRVDQGEVPFIDRTRTYVRRGGDQHLLYLAWEAPGYGAPDYFPFLVLTRLIEAEADGVLTRALDALPVDEQAALSAWWESSEGRARYVVELGLPAGADPARYHRLVQGALARALEWGIDDDDVRAVVRAEETETLIQREQLRHLAIMAAEPLARGGADFFLNYLEELGAVHAEEVGRVLGAYLVDSPHVALHILPREVDGEAGADAAVASPERSLLPNGAVLVTLRNPGSPLFAVHVAARDRAVVDGDTPGALNLVHRLLTSGVGGCDASCLAAKLRALGVQLKLVDDPRIPMDDYVTEGRFSFLRLECAEAQGPQALLLLLDMIRDASFTEDDLAREREAQAALLRRRAGSARAAADRLLARSLYGDHPLAAPPEGDLEGLPAITYDDVRDVCERAFAPANLIFAVVSPLSHGEIAALIDSALPARGEAGPGLPPAPVTEAPARVTETMGGRVGAVRLGALVDVVPGDAAALRVLMAVLSDRLQMDLRETRGLSYSVGAGASIRGDQAELTAWLNPPLPRLAEGDTALAGAVAAFDPATITAEELHRVVQARAGRLMMRRLSSIAQAYYLTMAELDGDIGAFEGAMADEAAVTLGDMVRAWQKYLDGRAWVTVVVD